MSGPGHPEGLTVLVAGPVPPPFGGIARYVQDLLASDLSRRHQVIHFNTSFTARVRSHGVNPGHRRYQPGGTGRLGRYAYVFSGGVGSGLRTLAAGIGSVPRFAWLALRRRPDVVHVFANMHWGFWRAGAMVLAARLLRRRVIFHPLGAIDQFYPSSGPLARRLITFLLDRAELILVQSPGLARIVSGYTRRPVRGIFNGIDLTPFAGNGSGAGTAPGPVFLAVGDLGHNKGTWDILEAAGRIAPQHPSARWVFVGRGDLNDLKSRARAAGVEDRVQLLGAVSEEEKLAAYAGAQVFLLPSYGEGQPLSILEAMAAGLPVISTPVGSIAEVIEPERNGLLVRPGDVAALAAAMDRLAADPATRTRMARSNREEARRRFDARRRWEELDAAWQEAAGRGAS